MEKTRQSYFCSLRRELSHSSTQEVDPNKMHTRSPDLLQKPLQIKQDDKFFTRLLSKESSIANSSFRIYHGVAAGAVPFMWESQPGTPKNTISTTKLPPLTPPPSYYYNYKKNPIKKHSKSSLLSIILPRINTRKAHVSPSSSSSSSSSFSHSLSSSSSPSTPSRLSNICRRRREFSSPRSLFSSVEDDEYPVIGSPHSPFCFPGGRESSSGLRGCYSMASMKNALLSIVRHGSSQGTA